MKKLKQNFKNKKKKKYRPAAIFRFAYKNWPTRGCGQSQQLVFAKIENLIIVYSFANFIFHFPDSSSTSVLPLPPFHSPAETIQLLKLSSEMRINFIKINFKLKHSRLNC